MEIRMLRFTLSRSRRNSILFGMWTIFKEGGWEMSEDYYFSMEGSSEHPCDDCIHYEKSWGACEYQLEDEITKKFDLFKPQYNGRECPRFMEKGKKKSGDIQ